MGVTSSSAASAENEFEAERRVALQQDSWFPTGGYSTWQYSTWRSLGLPTFDRLFSHCSSPLHLMVGLDGAGKSTLLYKLSCGRTVETIPTLGLNFEIVQYLDARITIKEFGGGEKLRPLLKSHLGDHWCSFRGILFVVDASNRERLAEARCELHQLLNASPGDGLHPERYTVPISESLVLIFANKQDLPSALSDEELRDALELRSLPQKDVHLQLCSATTGKGLYPGLKWYMDRFVQRVPARDWSRH